MKVSVFITLLNSRLNQQKNITEEYIIDIIKDLIQPINYISYDDKIKLIESVIQSTNEDKYKTPMRQRQLVIALVNLYTKLELDVKDFDILSENKLLNPIVSTFKSEYIICESLLKMMVDDMLMDGR